MAPASPGKSTPVGCWLGDCSAYALPHQWGGRQMLLLAKVPPAAALAWGPFPAQPGRGKQTLLVPSLTKAPPVARDPDSESLLQRWFSPVQFPAQSPETRRVSCQPVSESFAFELESCFDCWLGGAVLNIVQSAGSVLY